MMRIDLFHPPMWSSTILRELSLLQLLVRYPKSLASTPEQLIVINDYLLKIMTYIGISSFILVRLFDRAKNEENVFISSFISTLSLRRLEIL